MSAAIRGWTATPHEPPVTGDPSIALPDPVHRRAERVMGTVVSAHLPDGDARALPAAAAFAWLHEVDRRFSPYRPDSEVSRLIRGDLPEREVSADLREVLDLAEAVRILSDGAFDIRGHRPDGAPDPTGVVKGWAAERAVAILAAGGVTRCCLNAGGDVLVRGGRAEGIPWRVGVADPDGGTALVLEAMDLAVATSGTLERGAHIADGRTGEVAPEGLRSITVAGPSLARADAYATAAFAMGPDGVRWTVGLPGYGAAAITADGRLVTTPLLRTFRPTPAV
jgi:FAD:protein FMN transferase